MSLPSSSAAPTELDALRAQLALSNVERDSLRAQLAGRNDEAPD